MFNYIPEIKLGSTNSCPTSPSENVLILTLCASSSWIQNHSKDSKSAWCIVWCACIQFTEIPPAVFTCVNYVENSDHREYPSILNTIIIRFDADTLIKSIVNANGFTSYVIFCWKVRFLVSNYQETILKNILR